MPSTSTSAAGTFRWPLLPMAALAATLPLILHGYSCGHDFGFHLQSWIDAAEQMRHELLDLARHYFGPHGHGAHQASSLDPDGPSGTAEPLDRADDPAELDRTPQRRGTRSVRGTCSATATPMAARTTNVHCDWSVLTRS